MKVLELYAGTRSIGRAFEAKGEQHPRSKLTEQEVRFIRENYKPRGKEFGMRALGRRFGVNNVTIHQIIHNKSWKGV